MRSSPNGRRKRSGKFLVLAILSMPVVLGVMGLVLDGGMLMAVERQAQDAADGGAVAAAWDKLRGRSAATQSATATTYVHTYNGLSTATVTFNGPPLSGNYAGNTSFVEVIVTVPVKTMFIQATGVSGTQQVSARAVAGLETVSAGEGAIVLDPNAIPGLSVSGGGNLVVNGRVVVNSQGGGVDENGATVSGSGNAGSASNNSNVQALDVQVVGGVNTPANFQPITGTTSPLHCRALPEPDPLINLPTPTSGQTGVVTTIQGTVSGSGTYNPGIYTDIKVGTGDVVTFNPGIYIIIPSKNTDGISITGTANVTGNGVMFYLTGDNFNVTNGTPDVNDGSSSTDTSGTKNFASLTVNGSNVNLVGLSNSSSPYNGMLFYQRRASTVGANIQGNGTNTILGGTIYAKWAQFKLSGSAVYNAQFVVGSLAASGSSNLTINYAGKNLGKANQIYLVE
jgi:hypothetical protein